MITLCSLIEALTANWNFTIWL